MADFQSHAEEVEQFFNFGRLPELCMVQFFLFRAFFKDFPVGGHFLKRDLSVRKYIRGG